MSDLWQIAHRLEGLGALLKFQRDHGTYTHSELYGIGDLITEQSHHIAEILRKREKKQLRKARKAKKNQETTNELSSQTR